MKTYIGIVRDHSASMGGLALKAKLDFNQMVDDLKKNAFDNEIDTIVSVVECGVRDNYHTINKMVVRNSSVIGLKKIDKYVADGNNTPLFDAIGMLIESMMDVPDASSKDVCFLINVITDGEENASVKHKYSLPETMRELQKSDRWTFAFRVPRGHRGNLINNGIPSGNIMEWEQSNSGFEQATVAQSTAITQFYGSVARGETSSKNFYSTDLTGVSNQKVKNSLVDITNEIDVYQVMMNQNGMQIRDFVEAARVGIPMKKGAAFYQLTKKEDEVQDYKQILIRDKKTGKIYGGTHSRQLLGLPFTGTVKIVPGNHGNYDIFIQSTSVNRKLVGGTIVLYWDKIGEVYKDPQSSKTKQQSPQVGMPDPKKEHIRGYIDGFEDGKQKRDRVKFASAYGLDYCNGYEEGYKHGRGKKKRLYSSADLT